MKKQKPPGGGFDPAAEAARGGAQELIENRLRRQALLVSCPVCPASIGEHCVGRLHALRSLAARDLVRVRGSLARHGKIEDTPGRA